MDAAQSTEDLLGAAQTQMCPGNILKAMRDFVLHLVHCILGKVDQIHFYVPGVPGKIP